MTVKLAPAKVNLCLFLGPTRPDGRHELVTVFQALTLADRLEVEWGVSDDEVVCPGVEGPNLAARALELLRAWGWDAPPVRVTIDKRIPVAAGMGGGSADAAAVLALVDGPVRPIEIARQLGADVSALIDPGLWLAAGVGDDEMIHYPAGLGEHAYVVVPSRFGLSTPDVYREADRLGLSRPLAELEALKPRIRRALARDAALPSELVVNDLQAAALSLCPSIEAALDALIDAGAAQALVSGSGPTTVGIWWGEGAADAAENAAQRLSVRFHGAQAALPFSTSSQFRPSA